MKPAKLNQIRTLLISSRVTRDSRCAIHALSKRFGAVLLAWWFRRPAIAALIALTVVAAVVFVVQAANKDWANLGTDFNTATNWTGGTPGTADVARFPGVEGTQPNLSASLTIQELNFSAAGSSGYDLTSTNTGVALTITNTGTGATSAINAANTSGTNTIDAPIVLGAAAAATQRFNQAAGGTLIVNGVVSSTNSITLSLSGPGTIQLNGANIFAGGSTLNTANTTLILGNDSALSTGTLTTANSGTIQAGGGTRTIANAMTLGADTTIGTGNDFIFNGAVTASGAATRIFTINNSVTTLAGNVFLAESDSVSRTLSIAGSGVLSINGLITNNSGANTLSSNLQLNSVNVTLKLTNANTYTGTSTLANGTLVLGNKAAFGTGTVAWNGVTTSASTDLSGVNALSNNGTIGATGNIFAGSNNLELSGTLTSSVSPTITNNISGGTFTLSNTLNLSNSGTNRTFTFSGTGNTAVTGVIANGGGSTSNVVKSGIGTLTISGANTYTGTTTISAGTLTLGASGVLADSSNVIMNGGTFSTGAAAGFTETVGTLALTDDSVISLGSGSHTLTFAASNGVSWTAGKKLAITGWTGGFNGTSGTSGKIFVGSTSSGLTASQLAQVSFSNGVTNYTATILSTGEVVPVAPTAVKLTRFNAASFSDGVQLTWESGFEVNNLGYRLYREQNGKRTRVTPSLVAGSALTVGQGNRLTAGYSYSWFDPQGTPDTSYYLETIDLNGEREPSGPIYPYAGARGNASPKRERALLLNEVNKSLSNISNNAGGSDAAGWPASMTATNLSLSNIKLSNLAGQQAIAGGKAVKIQVRQSGWYRVTQPELVAAGFDPSSDARLLQLYVDGEEVPVRLSGEGARLNANDMLEFYGVALDTPTTDTRTYWLVNGTTAGKRISAKRPKIKPGDQNWTESPGLRSFAFTAERREKLIYSPRLLNGDADNIFGALIFTDPTDQTLTVKNFDREAVTPVQLEVALQGLTAQGHEVSLMLNGVDLGSMTFNAVKHPTAKFAVNRSLLREGDNTISLASRNGDADISFVDYVRLTYAHQYTADNNALRFSVPGGAVVRVDGFTTANIRLVDITDPNSPLEVATSGSPSGAGYAVRVQALGNDTCTFMAFADDLTAHPSSIAANKPSSWNANTNGADLVIITHRDFRQAIEPLATLRRSQGLSVAVVDVEDVYDEFSYGAHTPLAIKAFLMNAAGTWARKPGYLLLVGDSSWDPCNYMDQGANDFVPTKLIETNYMETASDDWLVDFTGEGRADMALGRLPGRTPAEVSLMVSKIIGYEQERELNVPLRGAVMVADNGFESQSAQTRALLPASVTTQSLNRAAIGNDDLMRGQLVDALNQGPMIVNFYGHGSVSVWTGAGVLDSDLAGTLTNANRSSIYLMMTCLNGYAHDAYIDSLSESVLKAPNGGAVAVWASSGYTASDPQFEMNSQFYRLLFGGQPLRLGEAAREAKLATPDLDVRRTWILLGDPTMRVR
ncbi:MAG TPA: C25 family cysteine peptidase [Pyrinomonadaceae bacterium]|nr:C25 family cysteine peptidase [Pyrinomonadaceae bacterium]